MNHYKKYLAIALWMALTASVSSAQPVVLVTEAEAADSFAAGGMMNS